MSVWTLSLRVPTKGHCHVVDITSEVAAMIEQGGLHDGTATLIVAGSTAGLTTVEFEFHLPARRLASAIRGPGGARRGLAGVHRALDQGGLRGPLDGGRPTRRR